MEGNRRGVVAWLAVVLLACAVTLGASGCGDEESEANAPGVVKTADPRLTFAPLVELPANDRYRPMSARSFIEESMLMIAEDRGCEDRRISAGRGRPEQQNEVTDWTFVQRLGVTRKNVTAYYRNPYDAKCELDYDQNFYADQLTRPHDPGPRPKAARPGVGFYLDLDDAERGGDASSPRGVPVYFERTNEGDSSVRLTYWMLFGMHAPASGRAHEGDWERVDVLVSEVGPDSYVPRAVQLGLDGDPVDPEAIRETPWDAVERDGGTHPRVVSAAGSHALSTTTSGTACDGCRPWRTWTELMLAREQLWYGYGGAWGEAGPTDATTGPLGPHGFWPGEDEAGQ